MCLKRWRSGTTRLTNMITIYSTKICAFCAQVEKLMQHKKVAYEKVYIDDNPELRQELFTKTHALTVPITTDGTEYVVGWNITKLMELIK